MKVEVLLFMYRAPPPSALLAIKGMLDHTERQGISVDWKIYGNALVHTSRNLALAKVSPDADYVLFVDDDMIPPKESLLRLIGHHLPIVSAPCTTKIEPIDLVARLYHEPSDQFVPLDYLRPNHVCKGKFAVGMAFCLVSRELCQQAIEDYLAAEDWMALNLPLMNRLHVRAEFREKERKRKEQIRRSRFERDRYLRVFDFDVGDDELQRGEDIAFSRRLLRMGVEVAIDTACQVGHMGERPYGFWDVEQRMEDSAA